MELGYIEKRKEELTEEFDKGAKALQELQTQGNKISEQMKSIQGAYAELINQQEVLNGSPKESTKKSAKGKKA